MIFALMRSPYVKLSRRLTIVVRPPPSPLRGRACPKCRLDLRQLAPAQPARMGRRLHFIIFPIYPRRSIGQTLGYLYHFLPRGFCPLLPQCTTTDLPISSGIGRQSRSRPSISFDVSVLERFWTLARGFKVVI